MVATGFCRNGPSNDDNMGNNKQQYRLDELDDVIATTSTVFLGLTMGCARCHDHKYDPVTSADYYSLLAVFNGTVKKACPKRATRRTRQKSRCSSKRGGWTTRGRLELLLPRDGGCKPPAQVHG